MAGRAPPMGAPAAPATEPGRSSSARNRVSSSTSRGDVLERVVSFYGLLIFSSVYLLAVATPGPGVAAIIARSLARGTQGAVAFIAGFLIGDLIWFALAATGLAALAQTAQTLFVVVKYAGAAYLLYLAYRLWTAPASAAAD